MKPSKTTRENEINLHISNIFRNFAPDFVKWEIVSPPVTKFLPSVIQSTDSKNHGRYRENNAYRISSGGTNQWLAADHRLCTFTRGSNRLSNCRTTGAKIVLVSFSDSYADEDKSGIRVAQYLTELPSKEVLLRQLQKSLAVAKDLSSEQWPRDNREKNEKQKSHSK